MNGNDQEPIEFEATFSDEYEQKAERCLTFSSLGNYLLLDRCYHRPYGFDYSRGTISRVSDGKLICDIKRNDCMFNYSFVVKQGQEWFISDGRSYLSQTLVNLDTEEEFELLPNDGTAFYWDQSFLSLDGNTLVVDGCYWACPYEYKFFDFTDPKTGWPELTVQVAPELKMDLPENLVATNGQTPLWRSDGLLELFETRRENSKESRVVAKTTLQRVGNQMLIVDQWVLEEEKKRRKEEKKAQEELEKWKQQFCSLDPIYLAMREGIFQYGLPNDPEAVGLVLGAKGVKNYLRRQIPKASADLLWLVDSGPISVQVYDSQGNYNYTTKFERSVVGMKQAMAHIAQVFQLENKNLPN